MKACVELVKPLIKSAFVIGSGARGGFSAVGSDLDLFLVINSADQATTDAVQKAVAACRDKDLYLAQRLSVFTMTPEQLGTLPTLLEVCNEVKSRVPGCVVCPQYDRLDFCTHGLVIFGSDADRTTTAPPTMEAVKLESTAFAVFLCAKMFCPTMFVAKLDSIDARNMTKLIMMPARFLCTLEQGRLADNDSAAAHFAKTRTGETADLVRMGHAMRADGSIVIPARSLKTVLFDVYVQSVDAFLDFIVHFRSSDPPGQCSEPALEQLLAELEEGLQKWRSKLCAAKTESNT
jgi:hypothetical protein